MFTPNLVGELRRRLGRDIHGQPMLGLATPCPFAQVNLESKVQKTSVRADSSGSRGSADEIASTRLKILVPAWIAINLDDEFSFDGGRYQVKTKHKRRSTTGTVDHIECDLEILP